MFYFTPLGLAIIILCFVLVITISLVFGYIDTKKELNLTKARATRLQKLLDNDAFDLDGRD